MSGPRAPSVGRAAFVLVLFAVALLGGCARLPDGTHVPIWQDPARGYVPEPVEVYPSLTCREFENWLTGEEIVRCE